MINAAITIQQDTATPEVQRVLATTTPARLTKIVGPKVATLTRDTLSKVRNVRGFPSTGLGEKMARATHWEASATGPVIEVNRVEARQLYLGGTIRPVNRKFLCFGITEQSYGKTPTEMGYVPGDKVGNRRLKGLFAFARQVTTQPRTDILPTTTEYSDVAIDAIGQAITGGRA